MTSIHYKVVQGYQGLSIFVRHNKKERHWDGDAILTNWLIWIMNKNISRFIQNIRWPQSWLLWKRSRLKIKWQSLLRNRQKMNWVSRSLWITSMEGRVIMSTFFSKKISLPTIINSVLIAIKFTTTIQKCMTKSVETKFFKVRNTT